MAPEITCNLYISTILLLSIVRHYYCLSEGASPVDEQIIKRHWLRKEACHSHHLGTWGADMEVGEALTFSTTKCRVGSGDEITRLNVRVWHHMPTLLYMHVTYFKNLKERSVWLRILKMASFPIHVSLCPTALGLPITINVTGHVQWPVPWAVHVVQLPDPRTPSSSPDPRTQSSSPESPCSWESRKSSPPCLSAEVCKPALLPPPGPFMCGQLPLPASGPGHQWGLACSLSPWLYWTPVLCPWYLMERFCQRLQMTCTLSFPPGESR